MTPFNVFTALPDNAHGDNTTLNSHGIPGTSATSSTLVLNNNPAQNAENISCSGLSTSLTRNYNFELYAMAPRCGAISTRLGEADTVVNVTPVPEPSILALTGLGIDSLLVLQFRRRH